MHSYDFSKHFYYLTCARCGFKGTSYVAGTLAGWRAENNYDRLPAVQAICPDCVRAENAPAPVELPLPDKDAIALARVSAAFLLGMGCTTSAEAISEVCDRLEKKA